MDEFEWDAKKAVTNLTDHGVSFEEHSTKQNLLVVASRNVGTGFGSSQLER